MADEIAAEYKTSLEDLTFNSKPVINMLTMVAEENIDYAEQIVGVIEERLNKVHPSQKLPVLYLIDSILKNIKNSTYHDLFKTNIVTLFAAVFEKVDEKTRQAMYKLRQTWTDIFGNKKLYSLDVRISQIDPAWPITAKPPEVPVTIHVNPKFLTKQQSSSPEINDRKPKKTLAFGEKPEHQLQEVQSPVMTNLPEQKEKEDDDSKPEDEEVQALIREQLLSKQQELIRIQQEKLELELMEARAKLEQQTRQLQAREQQMRMQLLQQLKLNESESCPEVKKEVDSKPKVRDPRLNRDPRISNRDPRSAINSNIINIEKKTENKNEKLKKNQTDKKSGEQTSHSSPSSDIKLNKQQTKTAEEVGIHKSKTNDQMPGPKRDARKKGFVGEEIRIKREEKRERVPVTKSGSKINKDEVENKHELEHTRRMRSTEVRDKSRSMEKIAEVKQNKNSPREPSLLKPELQDCQSRSRSPMTRNSRNRDEKRPQHSNHRDQRGSSAHKKGFDNSSRIEDKKSIHHGARHVPVKKRRETSPPKKKHEESPPKKRVRQGTGKRDPDERRLKHDEEQFNLDEGNDGKLSGDLEDLFGKEDKDYRRLPPIPKLSVNQQPSEDSGSDTLLSPRSAGWSKFKASRPENFPFTQPRSTAVLQRQESGDQFSSPLQSPPMKYQGYRTGFHKPVVHDSEGISPDQAGDILKLAEDQLLNGRLTPEQHRELVHQLTELHKLQKLKQQIREEKLKISGGHTVPADLQDPRGDQLGTAGTFPKLEGKFIGGGSLLPVGPRPHRGRIPRMSHPVHPRYHPYEPGVRRRGPLLPTPRLEDDHAPGPETHPRSARGPLLPTPDEPMVDLHDLKPDYEMPLDTLLPPEEESLVPVAGDVRTPDSQDDMRVKPPAVSIASDIARCRDGMIMSRGNRNALRGMDRIVTEDERDIPEYRQQGSKPLLAEPPAMPGRPRPMRSQPPIRPVYGPTRPLSKQIDGPHVRVPQPRRMSGITDDSLVGPDHLNDPENTFEPLAFPWYDTERFYCPQHDARWLKRATFADRDKSLYLNINNSKIQLPPHNKSREIYNMMTKLVIKFNEEERKLYINNEEVYTVGELPRMYYFNNKHFEVSIFGPPQSIWLDSVQYQLHEDAPPEPISLGENVYHFQIDSQKNIVIADGHEICPAGGEPKKIQLNYVVHEIRFDPPPRQILLDGKLCELNLKAKFPYLVIDGKPCGVRFDGSPRQIIIDTVPYMVSLDKPRKARVLGPRPRLLAFGGPGHEVIIDDMWYEVKFGAPPKEIKVGARTVLIELRGMPPEVKVLGEYVPIEQIAQRVGYPPGSNLTANVPNYVTHDGNKGSDVTQSMAVSQAGQTVTTTQPIQVGTDSQPVSSRQGTHPVTSGITPYQTSITGDNRSQPSQHAEQQPTGQSQQPAVPLDVSDLLTRLLKAGIIQTQGSPVNNEKSNSDDEAQMVERESVEEIPSLTDFVPTKLKKQYSGGIQLLSVGIQCASCGLRFVPEQKDKYREHLDWHFRQNKRGKDQMNMPKHRDWYYTITEWIQYEEIGDLENRTQSSFFDKALEMSSVTQSQGTRLVPGRVTSCPAVQGGDDVCAVCGEVFEQFWDEDEEEWHLRDAMRAEDGKTYHPVCYEDVNESNTSLTETPNLDVDKTSNTKLSVEISDGQVPSDTTADTTAAEPPVSQSATENTTNIKPPSVQSEPQETDYNKKLMDMVTNPLAYIASLTKQMNRTGSQPDLKAMDEKSASTNSTPVSSAVTSSMVTSSSSPVVSSTMSKAAETVVVQQVSPRDEEESSMVTETSAVQSTSIYSTPINDAEPVCCVDSPNNEASVAVIHELNTVSATPFPITGTPLPTVPSHSTTNSSPSPPVQSDLCPGGGTPVRDEPPLNTGGSTPVYDEPSAESGRGTPVEDEPMETSDVVLPSSFLSGSPIVHVITPIVSNDSECVNIKQEP
ncbi:hypothetical protein LSH36_84g01011 [Paralvinella palmiformis]|uniref:Pre-mRNA cleavage complex 2 protein Pcf11 n=1 Tax=Paralvinella palmiformis TaxID=53620 RepID=A0AAD9K1I0_9ANNE|nr:hypothetical protein LSH36_84g01011 [Paralvinella palmiformis]